MQAVIFASGTGSRLNPLTNMIPKCLIRVNGKVLLERMLEGLRKNNIRKIIITTGPHEEKIKKLTIHKYADMSISYIKNEKFETTNYIYSLWNARDKLTEDVITMHGDLIFDPQLLTRVVNSKTSVVLINKTVALPEKDFKARIEDGLVKEIGIDIFGDEAAFCIPVYKFLIRDWVIFMKSVNKFVREGQVKCYAENALNEVINSISLKPLYYTKEKAMEIDTLEDLKQAKILFRD